jgi:hypothetical protein
MWGRVPQSPAPSADVRQHAQSPGTARVPFPNAENPLQVDELLPGVIDRLGSDGSGDQCAIHVLVWAAIQACIRDYETNGPDIP